MDWASFFAMGGYAAFVWTSYAIALVLLVINAVLPILRERTLRARLRQQKGEMP